MADLELVGIHPDGDHLILMDADGERHRLVIDEALRAAVRRDRPHLEKVRSETGPRPRDIQAMIRAGASAADMAAEAGLPVEQVRRYEGPVIAEREYVAQRTRALNVGRSKDSPTLGDLVTDRLAARGVESQSLSWDARREGSDPWQVIARYHAGGKDLEATWEVDLTAGAFTALDDEARWLSETDLGGGAGRHLSPVRGSRLYDVESDGDITPALRAVDAVIRDSRPQVVPDPEPESAELTPEDQDALHTETLLAELNGNRGVRQRVEIDDDELAEQVRNESEPQPTLWDEVPGAHPAASRPQDATDATVLPGPGSASAPSGPEATRPTEPSAEDAPSGGKNERQPTSGAENTSASAKRTEPQDQPARSGRRSRRSRRTSVPSWDEIVFGAKND